MDSKIELALLVTVIGIAVAVIGWQVFILIQTPSNADQEKYFSAENPDDKCATPEGITDEKWREHMGHHPDLYEECLN